MRQHIANLALKLAGVPYVWGGSSPTTGFDCSGFCIWILQVFDVLPSGDWRAQGLASTFEILLDSRAPEPGDLAMYGRSATSISHVMMHVSDELVVGASGGDSTTTTIEEAQRRGACVKVKALRYRSDYLFSVNIGMTL